MWHPSKQAYYPCKIKTVFPPTLPKRSFPLFPEDDLLLKFGISVNGMDIGSSNIKDSVSKP